MIWQRQANFFGQTIFDRLIDIIHSAKWIHTAKRTRRGGGRHRLMVPPGCPLRSSRSANYIVFASETAHHQLIMEYMEFTNHRRRTAITLREVLIALLLDYRIVSYVEHMRYP